MQDLLSQEEIDALLKGIDGDEPPAGIDEPELTEVLPYELGEDQLIQRGAWPGVDLLAERFQRFLQPSLGRWLDTKLSVSSLGYEDCRFDDFQERLANPCSIHQLSLAPLGGSAMLVIDARLVFKLVELFFGGGQGQARIEGREFSGLELRVIKLFLERVCEALSFAWKPFENITPEVGDSVQQLEHIGWLAPEESLLLCQFRLSAGGTGGSLQLIAPWAMLKPLKASLGAGLASNSEAVAEPWQGQLQQGVKASTVRLSYSLSSQRLSLRDILDLGVGDIVPIDKQTGVVRANERALFSGSLTDFPQQLAVELHQRVNQ